VLGWTAIRGRLDGENIRPVRDLFFWQFPHFHSIAWLYREDYENARNPHVARRRRVTAAPPHSAS